MKVAITTTISFLALVLWACGGTETESQSIQSISGFTLKTANLCAVDAGAVEKKVKICHLPNGNPENGNTIIIGISALEAHTEHHDDFQVGCTTEEKGAACSSNNGENDQDNPADGDPDDPEGDGGGDGGAGV